MASEKPPTSDTTTSASKGGTLIASCHCGHVTLELPSAPTELNECRCSVCYKYGSLWAYYPRGKVMVTVAATDKDVSLRGYVRDDEAADKTIGFYHCSHCGCLTHWWGLKDRAADDRNMGVNARMLPESAIEGVKRNVSRC